MIRLRVFIIGEHFANLQISPFTRYNLQNQINPKQRIMSMRTVAILGAGPSGLVATKEALANGLEPTVFEKQAELGGVWHPRTGSVWRNMHTNISKFTTVFGDTPYSDTETFPSSSSVFNYLNDYADMHGLRQFIRFQTKVVNVEPAEGGNGSSGWKVTWKTGENDGNVESQTFSGIIVATGIFAQSSIPNEKDIPGLTTFPGRILHSNEYKNGQDFENLSVLTVGGSFSGAEIASDVAKQTKVSYHSFRRKFWILKRYLPDQGKGGSQIPLDLLFYNRKFYEKLRENQQQVDEKVINAKKNKNLLSFCHAQQNYEPLRISEEEYTLPINSVVSDNYLPQVEVGALVPIHGSIKEITGSTVEFKDGSTIEDVDAIIFATGFQPDLGSFFPQRILNLLKYDPGDRLQPLILYQECVCPELPNLFFVGMYKGPYFAVMEGQARWAARVLGGTLTLPPILEMEAGCQKEEGIRHHPAPRPQFPHPDYVLFADTIAILAQSFPNLEKLQDPSHTLGESFSPAKLDPGALAMLEQRKEEIAQRFMTEPVIPAHYNLVHSPRLALNQMDFVLQVLKQFENV